jgi:hypothetical protein
MIAILNALRCLPHFVECAHDLVADDGSFV